MGLMFFPAKGKVMYKSSCISNPRSKASPLEIFAQRHRLKLRRDSCGDQIIVGKYGDVADHGDGENLLVAFWGNGPKFSRLRASRIRRALEESYGQRHAGGVGGDEALILFSPDQPRSAQFFIRALGIRRKRRVSPDVALRLQGFRRIAGTALHAVATTPMTALDCPVVRTGGAK